MDQWRDRELSMIFIRIFRFASAVHSLLDCILVGAGKGSKYKVSAIGVTVVNGHASGPFINFPNFVNFFKI